jgi:GNAT superfamily N-acetyltransferase
MTDTATSAPITTRWINLWEATTSELAQIDFIIRARGWMKLNPTTTRVLVAESHGRISDFSVVQLVPFVGPLYVSPEHRASGVAERLADETLDFLKTVEARGWMVVAESPHTERLCRERNMRVLEYPVYTTEGKL